VEQTMTMTNGQLKTADATHETRGTDGTDAALACACGMDHVAASRERWARHQQDAAEAERREDPERFDEMAEAITGGTSVPPRPADRELLDDPAFAGKCRAVVEARERLLDAVAELRAGVVRRAVWEQTLRGLGVQARRVGSAGGVCRCGGCCDSRDVEIVVRLRAASAALVGPGRDGGAA
jgi:hypothetical protein